MSVPSFRLDGQVAVVTGASSGLGVILAAALAEQGCRLVLAARRAELLERVCAELCANGAEAVAVPSDVADPDHAELLVASALSTYGRLDGVVANAGIADGIAAEQATPALYDQVFRVNVTAGANLAGAAARHMIAAGTPGWIIMQSSILARKAGTGGGVAAYTASKAATEQLVRELARQWARFNIRVNALAPGYFPTAMNAAMTAQPGRVDALVGRIPMGRAGTADDLAGVVAFLASDAARYITGQTLPVDGGMNVW